MERYSLLAAARMMPVKSALGEAVAPVGIVPRLAELGERVLGDLLRVAGLGERA